MSRPRKKNLHLPACVHHRHGAFYYVKGGKWLRLGTALTDSLIEYSRIIGTPNGDMADLIDRAFKYMKEKRKPKLAENTILQYTIAATKLKKLLVQFSPDQIKPKHVASIKTKLAATPNMANRIISFLRVVFDLAVEWQEVESNPCLGIKRHVEAKRDRYITDEEYAAIYAEAPPQLKCIMDLCYLTAQRIDDVLKIRKSDVTAEGITFKQKKGGAKLLVRSSPHLLRVIEEIKALKTGTVQGLSLFVSKRGTAPEYKAVLAQWVAACKRAGVKDAHQHDLRAKSLTDAKMQGFDPTALAGHASPAMTQRYIRLRETPVVDGPSFGQSN